MVPRRTRNAQMGADAVRPRTKITIPTQDFSPHNGNLPFVTVDPDRCLGQASIR